MQAAALAIVCAFALWIAAGSVVATVHPERARGWIARFANSHLVNIAEQAWRGIAGAAMIVRASETMVPEAFRIAGWVLIVSSAVLLVTPLRWHSGYAIWWSRNLPLPAVRVAGAVGGFAAVAMAVAAVG